MGNTDTKLNFRKAVIQLTTKTQPVEASDDQFWDQFFAETLVGVQDFFTLIPAAEIRALREESPSNLATLCYKAVEKLVHASESACGTQLEQQIVLNCVRLLTRIMPYIFEDPEWRGFFWSTLPGQQEDENGEAIPLAQSLVNACCDLLFCPDFTVSTSKKVGPDVAEDLQSIDSCEYIWEAGVGFAHSPAKHPQHLSNRTDILKLILTCFSESMYICSDTQSQSNKWILYFTSAENRHALPLFTSLLNTVSAYDPIGYGIPYNHLMFTDYVEPLVETALQVLVVTLDHDYSGNDEEFSNENNDNLFINYLSRIHREEDFRFILRGLSRLLTNPLVQTYLPGSCKKVNFHQELLILFWKMCDANKKFLFYVLKSSDVLEVLVPILYHINDARADQSRVGLMHIGVFILLLLSGERNFGVRLNKPYTVRVPMDIPMFTGTHADLLIIVFHKIITTGHTRLQPLFDCLLTIIVNISPYLKTLSMVASTKLLHLLEAFSTPWFLFSSPTNHHLVFFLLEVFNNIIQYQFDGNSNLVYTIIRKRNVFHQLANLPTDGVTIAKTLAKKGKRTSSQVSADKSTEEVEGRMEGAIPAKEAEPGTLNASLCATPAIGKMTEESRPSTSMPTLKEIAEDSRSAAETVQPAGENVVDVGAGGDARATEGTESAPEEEQEEKKRGQLEKSHSLPTPPVSPTQSLHSTKSEKLKMSRSENIALNSQAWTPTPEWVISWKQKLPLQTIMRMLQVLVPQVEKICIDKGLTDESEILKFLQHGTLVGLLPVPHPILIRKYQANQGTSMWFRTYMWGVIYLRNVDPPIWYDTDVKLFEIQRI